MISYGLLDILRQRIGQPSFHVASGQALRVEFMRFSKGQELGPLTFGGDLVATSLEGTFIFGDEGSTVPPLTQMVVPEGDTLSLRCTSDVGAVQIIWAPPFAKAKPV